MLLDVYFLYFMVSVICICSTLLDTSASAGAISDNIAHNFSSWSFRAISQAKSCSPEDVPLDSSFHRVIILNYVITKNEVFVEMKDIFILKDIYIHIKKFSACDIFVGLVDRQITRLVTRGSEFKC